MDPTSPGLAPTAPRLARPRRSLRAWALWLAGLLLPLAALAYWVFGPTGLRVEQTGKTWRLEIEVERLRLETSSGWCDRLPAGAEVLSRRRLDSDPSGERAGPAEHCHYRSPQWRTSYLARREGQAPQTPQWPRPELRPGDPERQGLGEERLGPRQSFYELQLSASDGRQWSCRQSLADWQARPERAHYRMQVDRFGVADCASLPPLAKGPDRKS